MINLDRALFSHCEYDEPRPDAIDLLLEMIVTETVGAPVRFDRLGTYLQGPVTLLDEEVEFRIHVWFDLPESHPRFPGADRGLACLVQALDRQGLRGPTFAGVGWLGRPLEPGFVARKNDWVAQMIAKQGYININEAEWMERRDDTALNQVLAWFLSRHLVDMENHVILEERLHRR